MVNQNGNLKIKKTGRRFVNVESHLQSYIIVNGTLSFIKKRKLSK